jgi:hypothetical protein
MSSEQQQNPLKREALERQQVLQAPGMEKETRITKVAGTGKRVQPAAGELTGPYAAPASLQLPSSDPGEVSVPGGGSGWRGFCSSVSHAALHGLTGQLRAPSLSSACCHDTEASAEAAELLQSHSSLLRALCGTCHVVPPPLPCLLLRHERASLHAPGPAAGACAASGGGGEGDARPEAKGEEGARARGGGRQEQVGASLWYVHAASSECI